MKIRIGHGMDVHRLQEGKFLCLGGIKIPHNKEAVAHSDGDVLIHAICDALFGAANMRDIGHHFPDSSEEYKGIDSKVLLKKCTEVIFTNGYKILNIDTTICLQNPKVSPYFERMRETLAETMNIPVEDISIKATTTEKLGYIGAEEGISAYAVALIEKYF